MAAKKLCDFVGAEDDGEPLGLLGEGDAFQDVPCPRVTSVEEPQGGEGLAVEAPGDLLLLDEVEEVGPDVVAAEVLG